MSVFFLIVLDFSGQIFFRFLIILHFSGQIFVEPPSIKFHENPCCGRRVICERTAGRTDTQGNVKSENRTDFTVVVRNFTVAPTKYKKRLRELTSTKERDLCEINRYKRNSAVQGDLIVFQQEKSRNSGHASCCCVW